MSPSDIVTLDNFHAKMSRWEPHSSSQLYALVDMGSNGIRFSISDLSPPRTRLLQCIYAERAAVSLFDALHEGADKNNGSMVFAETTIRLVSETLARFRSIAVDDYGVPAEHVSVFATEAMRRADNAGAMLDAIKQATPDLAVQILAPEVETLFGAVGARSGFVDVKGLLLDLGGGSVQMTYMDTRAANAQGSEGAGYELAAARAGQSLPFGAARLSKILDSADAEFHANETSKLRNGMKEAFQNLQAHFPSLAAAVSAMSSDSDGSGEAETNEDTQGLDIYLCGGGFRGYGHMLMHNDPIQPYPIPSVNTYTVPGSFFSKPSDMLKVNQNFEGKVFGMSKRRRSQFAAIVTVVEALIKTVPRIRTVTFCGGGNRQGALMMKLPPSIREENPLKLVLPPSWNSLTDEQVVLQSVLSSLRSALPSGANFANIPTIFTIDLETLFVRQIWANLGDRDAANAAAALHEAVAYEPSCPGLTHLARAVWGLTLCARWDATFASTDISFYQNLRRLCEGAHPDASFWADYIGAVAATLATCVPCWPRTPQRIRDALRFEPSVEQGKKKLKCRLGILLSRKTARGIDLSRLESLFKGVGRDRKDDRKLVVTVSVVDSLA